MPSEINTDYYLSEEHDSACSCINFVVMLWVIAEDI